MHIAAPPQDLAALYGADAIRVAVDLVGGPGKAAAICELTTPRTVYKWMEKGRLPRTEYSGETDYASRLAGASNGQFTADWLLEHARHQVTRGGNNGPHQGDSDRERITS